MSGRAEDSIAGMLGYIYYQCSAYLNTPTQVRCQEEIGPQPVDPIYLFRSDYRFREPEISALFEQWVKCFFCLTANTRLDYLYFHRIGIIYSQNCASERFFLRPPVCTTMNTPPKKLQGTCHPWYSVRKLNTREFEFIPREKQQGIRSYFRRQTSPPFGDTVTIPNENWGFTQFFRSTYGCMMKTGSGNQQEDQLGKNHGRWFV